MTLVAAQECLYIGTADENHVELVTQIRKYADIDLSIKYILIIESRKISPCPVIMVLTILL